MALLSIWKSEFTLWLNRTQNFSSVSLICGSVWWSVKIWSHIRVAGKENRLFRCLWIFSSNRYPATGRVLASEGSLQSQSSLRAVMFKFPFSFTILHDLLNHHSLTIWKNAGFLCYLGLLQIPQTDFLCSLIRKVLNCISQESHFV